MPSDEKCCPTECYHDAGVSPAARSAVSGGQDYGMTTDAIATSRSRAILAAVLAAVGLAASVLIVCGPALPPASATTTTAIAALA